MSCCRHASGLVGGRCMLSPMNTPGPTSMVSPPYEHALGRVADEKSNMNPTAMTAIAHLLVTYNNAEKCLVHYLMDNHVIGADQNLQRHWRRTKSSLPGCLPTDSRLWRELLALARQEGVKCQ